MELLSINPSQVNSLLSYGLLLQDKRQAQPGWFTAMCYGLYQIIT